MKNEMMSFVEVWMQLERIPLNSHRKKKPFVSSRLHRDKIISVGMTMIIGAKVSRDTKEMLGRGEVRKGSLLG